MTNLHVTLAKGLAVVVVLLVLAVGGYVLLGLGGFSESGLLLYLLTLSFALTGARGIWADRSKVATVGAVGMLAVAVIQSAIVVGLAALLVVAAIAAYSGRASEQLESGTDES